MLASTMTYTIPRTTRLLTTAALSTTHRGTAFEERALHILQQHLSMSLRRVGGKSDGGIDLLGWWWLPPQDSLQVGPEEPTAPRRRLRVLAQCKAEKKPMGPKYVREMEGVMYRHTHADPADARAVAVLVSESAFTKAAVLRAQSSPVPFLLLQFGPVPSETVKPAEPSPVHTGEFPLLTPSHWDGGAGWNHALRKIVGRHLEIRPRYSVGGGGAEGQLVLMWNNRLLQNWVPDDATAFC